MSLSAMREEVSKQPTTFLERRQEEQRLAAAAARKFVDLVEATRPLNLAALEELGSSLRRSVLSDDHSPLSETEFLEVCSSHVMWASSNPGSRHVDSPGVLISSAVCRNCEASITVDWRNGKKKILRNGKTGGFICRVSSYGKHPS